MTNPFGICGLSLFSLQRLCVYLLCGGGLFGDSTAYAVYRGSCASFAVVTKPASSSGVQM